MLEQLLQYFRHSREKKADRTAVESSTEKPAPSGKRVRIIIIAASAVLTVIVGFMVSVMVLRTSYNHKEEEPTLKTPLVSNLPKPQPQVASLQETLKDTPHAPDGQSNTPGGQPMTAAQNEKVTLESHQGAVQPDARQGQQVDPQKKQTESKLLTKQSGSRPVAEYDPFKTEFLKKYEMAEKKGKKSHPDNHGDLDDLESALKKAGPSQKMTMLAPPPPPPPPKSLQLTVYGVVIPRGAESYAITDRGVIRVGNTVDTFTVSRIDFDIVTLTSKENAQDVRHIFVKASPQEKNPGQPGMYVPLRNATTNR